MKALKIQGSKRESVGKSSSKALRNAGLIPCVLYGGDQPLHFAAEENQFLKLVYTPDVHTVDIKLDGDKVVKAILQDIQFHPVTDKILHVDFYELHDDKPVTIEIPVNLLGTARGVLNGGVLRRNFRRLKVKALPKDLPDYIEIDISKLRIGQKVYVREIRTEDYTIMHPDNVVVCMVKTSRNVIEDTEDEEESTEEGAPAEAATEESAES